MMNLFLQFHMKAGRLIIPFSRSYHLIAISFLFGATQVLSVHHWTINNLIGSKIPLVLCFLIDKHHKNPFCSILWHLRDVK